MKKTTAFLIGAFLTLSSFAHARTTHDYDFEQERMMLTQDSIYIVSSFEDNDKVSCYSYFGEPIWDVSFFAKVTSWQVMNDYVIVFSKHRSGYSTYLTCLDRYTGKKVWQRP